MTPLGRGLLAMGVLLVISGLLLAYPEVVLVGLVCILLSGGSWLLSLRRPRLESSRRVEPTSVTRGDAATGRLTVRSAGRLPIAARPAADLINGVPVPITVPRMAPGARVETSYDLPTRRRGVVEVGPVVLTYSDLFGLATREQRLDGLARLFVRPRAHAISLPTSGRARTVDGGEADRALEGSVTFHTLREYVPGDDRRRVHWRTSARTGTLMVKQHVDLTRPECLIVLDVQDSQGDEDAFEEAVDVVASIAVAVLRGGDPVWLVTNAGESYHFEGPDAIDEALDSLATVQRQTVDDLIPILPLLSGRSGSLACFVGTTGAARWLDSARHVVTRFGTTAVITLGSDSEAVRSADVLHLSSQTAEELIPLWDAQVAR